MAHTAATITKETQIRPRSWVARRAEPVRVKALRPVSKSTSIAIAHTAEERERLVMEHLPQVRYIARRIHDRLPQHVSFEDLVHAGILGLLDALNKFDPSKHVQLSSYAKFRIRGAILDSLREQDWSPRELRRQGRRIEEADGLLRARLGRSATEQELASELGMKLEELQHLQGELRGLDLGSLQMENPEDGADGNILNFLPNAPEESPYFICQRDEMKRLLARAIDQLAEKERQVLALYYFEELNMKEVGRVLGVSESRVSQIHSMALVRVRDQMQNYLGTGRTTNALL